MKMSMPDGMTAQIAAYAAQLAREDAFARGWKSHATIRPVHGVGYVGLKTTAKQLMYQEKGTRPHVMYHLEGKVIPIAGPGGTRFVRAVGVGQPGWVTLPGGVRKWRDQKWRHPGITATNFMANSIKRSIMYSHPQMKRYLMQLIGYET